MSKPESNVPSQFLFQVLALLSSMVDYDHRKSNEPSSLLRYSWLECFLS